MRKAINSAIAGLALLGAVNTSQPTYAADTRPKARVEHAENGARKISQDGVNLIKKYEGFQPRAYWDTDAWAIGYGTRNGVKKGDKISREEAERRLRNHVSQIVDPVIKKYVKVPLNQNQYDALASFIYNHGASPVIKSTLLKEVNEKDFNNAVQEFYKWDMANGKHLPGLKARRVEEASLFTKK